MILWKNMWRDRRARFGLIILGCMMGVALLGPLVHHVDPLAQRDVAQTRLLPPLAVDHLGTRHWLGTDALGRDLLARLIHGSRISLAVGVLSMLVSVVLGAGVGVVSALWGGWVGRMLMGLTDTVLAMPRLVILLALVTLWEPSLMLTVLVVGFTGWMSLARLTRAEARGVLARPYTVAARSAGVDRIRLMWRHVVPNSMTPVIIVAALSVGNAIMLEAGLSFLGLGIPAPAPSWGNMIAAGRDTLVNAPWVATFPGMAIVLAVVACNLLGDGVRDVLDPRMERA